MQFVLAASKIATEKCILCSKQHNISNCKQFLKLTIKERWGTIKKLRVCFRCFKNHLNVECKAKPCGKDGCTRKHNVLLHQDKPKLETNKVVTVNHIDTSRTYLKIVPVELSGPDGSVQITALLDEGSTVTLLLDEVANRIGAVGPKSTLQIEGISGQQIRNTDSRIVDLKIKGLFARNYERLQAHTIDSLNLRPQAITKDDVQDCPHLEEIEDQLIHDGPPPTLLIGQDNWHLIVTREMKTGDSSKPVASLTSLGWILHGYKTETSKPVFFVNNTDINKQTEEIDQLIKNHFNLDSIGITPKKPINDPEQRAMSILEKTTHRLPEGRFECGLLWRSDNEQMPHNKNSALRRLKGIETKMHKNEEFKLKYTEQIKNLLAKGYAEPAISEPTSPRTWYLPHFAVIHPQKGKLRLVFDAAERTGGKSLNDTLLSGPDLLQSLFGVLVRFRQGPVAVAADIKEMFLRIKIRTEDRDSLRFLWRERESDTTPKEYRMTSLIFGATSSPCSAIFVKNKNADEFIDIYPQAVDAIKRCHYMDDYLQSFTTAKEALRISRQVDKIHKNGGFELRGWTSNDPAAIQSLETDTPELIPLGDHEKYGKTLGMLWQTSNDALKFTLNLRNTPDDVRHGSRSPTKREVASAVMSVFDPLGLATPILIQGKTLIQQLWRTGIGWDESIPDSLLDSWTKWHESLARLENLDIPRCTNSHGVGELHTFVDASETTYAAATYWKSTDQPKSVRLIAAKAKVAPLKPTSIPRLELQAALLGCRLATNIENEIDATVTKKYYWSDSRTVLAWIKSDPRTFKTFVAHRLAEIEDLTKPSEWRYVPTKQNVADDATRMIPPEFNVKHRWFNGPEFLGHSPEEWPKDHSERPISPTGEERHTVATIQTNETPLPDVRRFSSWSRYLRATARFLQCVAAFKNLLHKVSSVAVTKRITRDARRIKPTAKRKSGALLERAPPEPPPAAGKIIQLTNDYLKSAEELIVRQIQTSSFGTEFRNLKEGKGPHNQSRLRQFTLVLKNDVIHLETRLSAARDVATSYKLPIVLDGKHPITRLIIQYYHNVYNHGNHNTVMNELRQKYYITSLRNTVKAIARECQWCRTHKAVPTIAPVGDLPIERLQQRQHPFTCTAVDYFGPITVTVGRRTEKRWVALYTCLTTRAVHLEIATSLSSDSMILTLRKMIARRGTPKVLFSDNGSNFLGADKELQSEFEKMKEQTEERGIRWKRIAPGAPNMGGSWERLVRSVKTALTATLNTRHPREEILHTLLLEAEHLVNSRPITEVSLDPDEPEGLTPNHFLIGRSSGAYRMGDFTNDELIGPATWKTVQRLTDHFWKRWLVEYLPLITPRYNNHQDGFINPAVGDIVIIIDNTLPRGTWPKGEIVNTYPGPDGRIRIVDVRTTAGVLKRPVSRLVKITQSSATTQSASESIFAPGGDC